MPQFLLSNDVWVWHVFATALSDAIGMKEASDKEIYIEDVRYPVFKTLLEYCYCSNASLRPSNVVELLMATNQYRLGNLKQLCESYIQVIIYDKDKPWNIILNTNVSTKNLL